MLSRRSSTDPNPGNESPRPTSGSFGGTRSLSLATNQESYHATTAQVVETESPQSETFPQDTPIAPPMPPRPPPFPELPPRNNLKRQSTRCNTDETFGPALDFPSQPPDIMPMPAPPPLQSQAHPPTPLGPGQLAPGEGVGGFALTFSPQQPASGEGAAPSDGVGGFAVTSSPPRGFSWHYSLQHIADYADRFGPASPPRSDSNSSDGDSTDRSYRPKKKKGTHVDMSGGIHADVWPTYNKVSQAFDEKKLEKWNKDLEVLLLFAALFSAVVTAFLITSLSSLGPNYQQQSALLLYQLLNGRDPNLASISDPTASFQPSGLAIAANCLWSASLSASLGASFGAMICKEWLTDYNGGTNPVVGFLRACQRQVRFTAFQRWKVHIIIALLPPLLHSSVLLFFSGAVVYLWQINVSVAIVYLIIGGIFGITYFILTFLPFVTNPPFRLYSTLLVHRLSVVAGEVIISVVDVFAHGCFLALRYVTGAILWPFAQTIFSKGSLHAWYLQGQTILPNEYRHMRVWWANAFRDSLDEIDTSQRVQEEAILWLSQMPLDPSESKVVVPSLALIPSSHLHKLPNPTATLLNLAFGSSFLESPTQEQADIVVSCVLLLGHIKYKSVVDRNSDEDHDVGGNPVTPLAAWAAQQLTINAFDKSFNAPHSEWIRARFLMAAAWLSPEYETEEVTAEGEKLKIQDRWGFLEKIRMSLAQHFCGDKPLDNRALVDLIHGMHACIPRGNYGSASSVISFLSLGCEDYNSPWSEDESVLRALITYALDLLLPPERRRPLVERETKFNRLASELINALKANVCNVDVASFGFWLIYRVPYAFTWRKSALADIANIWDQSNTLGEYLSVHEGHSRQMNPLAINAFVAVAQCHLVAKAELPELATRSSLKLLGAALQDSHSRTMATYAMAMILNLGSSTQVSIFATGISAEYFTTRFHAARDDLEANVAEEDIINLHIYSTLVLLKLRQAQVDVERVGVLIREMENTIKDSAVADSGLTRDSTTEMSVDLNRLRWKAIYLSGLLFKLLPPDEWEGPIGMLRERVRMLLESGVLLLADDYKRCIEPLDMEVDVSQLRTSAERRETNFSAFGEWVSDFPLFSLAGSVMDKT